MTGLRVVGFHLRQLVRNPFFRQQAIAAPACFMLLLQSGSWEATSPLADDAWSLASVAGLWSTTTTAVGIIGFQRFQGTLEHLSLSALRPGVVFGGLCAAAALLGLAGVPVALALQFCLTQAVGFSATILAGLLLSALACVVAACVLASIFVISRSATAYEPVILTPVWLLSGVVLPATALPPWISGLALAHPLTGAVQVVRSASWHEALPWGAASLVATVGWALIAGGFLTAALKRARVDATLALA